MTDDTTGSSTGSSTGSGAPDAAVILAGGQGRRLGGRDKPALSIGGRSLLDRALGAVAGIPVVVVGPSRTLAPGVRSAREDPAGGGPAAAVAAGIGALPELPDVAIIAVLAADLPGVGEQTIARLCAALPAVGAEEPSGFPLPGGAVLLDPEGRRQYLIGIWRCGELRSAIDRRADWHNAPLRDLLAPIRVVEVAGSDREADDIDTPADLAGWAD